MAINEHTLELLAISRAQPFSYDHDAGEFHFGPQAVKVEDVLMFGSPHEEGESITAEQVLKMSETVPFVHNHIHPIGLPLASDFIDNGWTQALQDETNEVMADVFIANTDRFQTSERKKLLAIRAFSAMRRTDPGDTILTTVGDCACLGPDFTAMFTSKEQKVMEYTYHNIDKLEQKVSLMAGLGHVARRANEWL